MQKHFRFLLAFSLIVCMESALAQWQQAGASYGVPNHYIYSIALTNDNTAWAIGDTININAFSHRILRKTVSRNTWNVMAFPGLGTQWLFDIAAIDSNTAWVCTNGFNGTGFIFKTTDGGASWVDQSTGTSHVHIHFFDSQNGLTYNAGRVHTTSNGGVTWTLRSAAQYEADEYDIIYSSCNHRAQVGNTMWVGSTKGRVFKTTDRGVTWTILPALRGQGFGVTGIAFKDASNGLAVSIVDTFGNYSGISKAARTTDGGVSWTLITPPSNHSSIGVTYVPATPGTYMAFSSVSTNGLGCSYTTNNGDSWTLVDNGTRYRSMVFSSPTKGYAGGLTTGSFGGMFEWTGNLLVPPQVWTPQTISPTAQLYSIKAVNDNVVWAGADSGRYLRTTNGGTTWVTGFIPNASSLIMNSIAPINRDTAYFEGTNFNGGDGRIYKTTNGGATWALQYQNTAPEVFFNSIAFWDKDNGIAESDPVGGSFHIVTTTNGGATWNQTPGANIPPPLPGEFGGFGDGGGTVLAVQGTTNAWFATAYGPGTSRICRVFRSTNKGLNWTVANTPFVDGGDYFGSSTIIFRDALNGFVGKGGSVGSGPYLAKTTDGGVSWNAVPTFIPDRVFTLLFVPGSNGNTIVGTTPSGSAVSRNGGGTWSLLSSEYVYTASFASATAGWGVGINAGTLFRYVGSPLTSIAEQPREFAPSMFALEQNYPNPFNPTTEIKFSVAEQGRATLDVFNILGQKVATLFDDAAEAGQYYKVQFNAGNLASGVYLYKLQSQTSSEVKKLMLLR